jgi:hypothetical protein
MDMSMWLEAAVFISATVSVCVYYLVAQAVVLPGSGWFTRLRYLPLLLSVGVGLSVNNARAVLQGLLASAGEFVRTPKYCVLGRQGSASGKKYRLSGWLLPWVELAMALYFVGILVYSATHRMFAAIPFQLLFFGGFLYLSTLSLIEARRRQPAL